MAALSSQRDAPLLSVRDLAVSFGSRGRRTRVVHGIDLTVSAGETLAIVGESGSGKSVTAQAVMGLLPPATGKIDGGSIFYRGVDLLARPPAYTRALCGPEMAMIFQDPLSSLNPVFRVGWQIGETLRRFRGVSRRKARDKAIELMQRVGIPAAEQRVDDFPHQFSGGMRQRVMIAMALALQPKLLIADEPTTALDVTVQAQIMDLLQRLKREEDMALILITHDLGLVAETADRVLMMYSGGAVETGPIREVYERSAHPYTRGLLGSIPSRTEIGQRLVPIRGTLPDPRDLPPGCPFAPRCDFAVPACLEARPPLLAIEGLSSTHRAACNRAEEVAHVSIP